MGVIVVPGGRRGALAARADDIEPVVFGSSSLARGLTLMPTTQIVGMDEARGRVPHEGGDIRSSAP
jgi:hypothetical protein